MSARDDILARVRAGVGKGDAGARRAAALARLQAGQAGPQPTLVGDLVERFCAKAESLASTVARVDGYATVPAHVAEWLSARQLPLQAVTALDVAGLDWAEAGLSCHSGVAVDADPVGISGCFCAIAETGTLMLLSGPATPASVSLLPETHIALVPAARVVATMEDAFALLKAERGALPRAVNFVSGPSRTGDIEQTIVLGAHGPCRVHLIVIGENS
ncbi:MAG: lactate utilization protein [Dechloromonas sp.]|jgi:L-lactate dehydrogenase complex protein LldG|nr:lactate utilization protein [Dechloromonas sp.]